MEPATKKSESDGEDSSNPSDKIYQLKLSSDSQHGDSATISRARRAAQPGDRTGRRDSASRWRGAARKVQTMQTVTKTFSNSQQVRDAVYEDWLARKSHAVKTSQRQLHEERMKRESDLKMKSATRAERAKKTLPEWNEQKRLELAEKQKQMRQQARERIIEDESERERKKVESAAVYTQWRKKRTEQMLRKHRAKKREEERDREEKEAEHREKVETSRKVLEIWNQSKDRVLRESARKAQEEKRRRSEVKISEKKARAVEADQAIRKWKERKRSVQGTNRPTPATPRQAWCPARTLHNVPTSRLSRIQSSRKLSLTTVGRGTIKDEESYSQESFVSSEETASSCSDSGSKEAAELSDGGQLIIESTTGADQTGTLKTVQVCCKTLEYFCTCDNK